MSLSDDLDVIEIYLDGGSNDVFVRQAFESVKAEVKIMEQIRSEARGIDPDWLPHANRFGQATFLLISQKEADPPRSTDEPNTVVTQLRKMSNARKGMPAWMKAVDDMRTNPPDKENL